MKTLGQIAFEAYVKAVGGKTYDEKLIPTWENLTKGQEARDAWEAAGAAAFAGLSVNSDDPIAVVAEDWHDHQL
jgi:hypothetical protein